MKHLFALIISAAFLSYSVAQEEKTIYVIDGYTLEPLTDFKAVQQDTKYSIRTDHNTIVLEKNAKGAVVISKEGYNDRTVDVSKNKEQSVVLEPTAEQKMLLRKKYIKAPADDKADNPPLTLVDEFAMFPGEARDLNKFLATNVRYPQDEIELEIEGKLFVKFIVETDGSITNITITKGLTKNTELETIRVIKLMPRWIPAKKDGAVVRSYFNLPVTFVLD